MFWFSMVLIVGMTKKLKKQSSNFTTILEGISSGKICVSFTLIGLILKIGKKEERNSSSLKA